jgi:hypothetical protein
MVWMIAERRLSGYKDLPECKFSLCHMTRLRELD